MTNDKHYNSLLEKQLYEVEKRSQQKTGLILAATIIVMNLFARADHEVSMAPFLNFTHLLSAGLVTWFLLTSYMIYKGVYHYSFKYINLIVQVSTVTFYMLASARLVDASFALSSTAPLFYLLVIGLTSMALNPLLSLLAGGFAAGQFVIAYALWLHAENPYPSFVSTESAWVQVTLKAIVFVVMGVVAMFIARSSRGLLEKVVTQVSYEEQLKFIEDDMSQAAEIQDRLIPSSYINPRCFNVETFYSPAKQVSGDYFDVIELINDRCLVVIADVSGKGYSAALLMSNIQAMVRTLATQGSSIEEIARLINKSVFSNSVRGKFLTIAFIELDPIANKLKYVNCGHNPPLKINKQGETSELDDAGPVLGVLDGYPCHATELDFNAGDILFAYTDGLSELRDSKGNQLGLQGIIDAINVEDDLSPIFIKQLLLSRIYDHSRDTELADDLSFVCIQSYDSNT